MRTSYQYTQNIGSLFQDSVSQAKTFYCREDFDVILKRYKKAPADSKVFIKRELDEMCKARGLESWILQRDPKVLETIPTRAEILDQLIDTFYALRKEVPSAHDYMKRIVHQLAPDFDRDPVRVAILKKYVLGAGKDCKIYDTSSIIAWVLDKMDERERIQFDSANEQVQIEMVVNKLDDSIFKCGLTTSELTWRDVLMLIKKRDNFLRNDKGNGESEEEKKHSKSSQDKQEGTESDQDKNAARVITAEGKEVAYPAFILNSQTINEELRTYLGLSKEAEISCVEIIDLLINKIDQGSQHTDSQQTSLSANNTPSDQMLTDFSATLEKQFRKHLNQFTYRTKKGSIAELVEKYKDDRRYAKRQKQSGDWSLLTLCEDLANGAFKTNNRQTRVNLYHFAIMFDMTIALQATDIYDPKRDLRKNLFEDYYCDNLVRYLGQSPLNLAESSGWEKEPSGEGINLKNYAEAIYIYYLYRRDLKLTSGQKITRAENAIQYCKNAPSSSATKLPANAYTQYYTEQFIDFILDAKEEDLTKLILDYYDIRGIGATPIQKAAQQNTAAEFVAESLAYLDNGREADYALDTISKERKDQIAEIAEATSISFDWRISALLKARYDQDKDFVRLLDKLETRLSEEFDWVSGRKKAILALTLQALYHNSSQEDPIRMEKLKKIIQQRDLSIDGELIVDAAKTLNDLGFDVHRLSGNSESLFYLGTRDYTHETMNRIIKKVETRYEPDISSLRKLFTEILAECEMNEKTVTRTTVLSICLSHYVEMLQDTDGISSFPDLYEDFAAYVNPILEDCRFQPLHEKNILDMYIILSLFFYVTENGKE